MRDHLSLSAGEPLAPQIDSLIAPYKQEHPAGMLGICTYAQAVGSGVSLSSVPRTRRLIGRA